MRSPKSLAVTSPLHATARPPVRSMRPMVCLAGASSRSFTTTAAPSRASRSATCWPMPRPDPVTTATLPSSCPMPFAPPRATIAADHTRSAAALAVVRALRYNSPHEHRDGALGGGALARRRGGGDRGPDAADLALPRRDARGPRAPPGVARPALHRRGGPPSAERPRLRGEGPGPDRDRRHLYRQRQGPGRPAPVPHAPHRVPRGPARGGGGPGGGRRGDLHAPARRPR